MGTPFVGEIRMFGGSFAPVGWAFCQGQLLAISENETLFNLIGTTYGGDGQSTFALPDLRGRVPVHMGTSSASGGTYVLGQTGGVENVTLTTSQIPPHSHVPQAAAAAGSQASPSNNVWAGSTNLPYSQSAPAAGMAADAIGSTGGSQPHDNMIPYLVVNFIISLFGIFPSPT